MAPRDLPPLTTAPSPLASAHRDLLPLAAAPVPRRIMEGKGVARGVTVSSCPRALQSHAQLRPRPPPPSPPPPWGRGGEGAPGLSAPASTAAAASSSAATTAPTATAALAYCANMASLRVLAFDHEGRPVQFDTWLDDLQLYLLSDSKDNFSLFDLASGAATAPPAIADSATRSQDHFLNLDPTSLTVDLLEQHLLAVEPSAVAVGVARGTPHSPFFEGCSPSPLAPSYASATAGDVSIAEDIGAASASANRRSSKGKGGRGGSGGGGGGSGSSGGGSSGGGGGGGTSGGSGGSGGGGGGSGGGGSGGGGTGARRSVSGGGQRQQQQRPSETQSPQQLREWFLQRGASGGSVSCPYVIPTSDRAGHTCGRLHTQHRCFSRLDDAWHAEFGDDVELPLWADLLRSRVAIFDLDFDAILFAMYASSVSAEGDCYRCVPPNPAIAAAALGASESGTLPGLHLPLFSTNLVSTAALQDAMVTTTTPGGQRVLICTCTQTGRHLATFTRPPGSSLYTFAIEPSQVAAFAQVPASPAPPFLPCVEWRQRAAPHSSSFPPTAAPLQTLHMDVWGPARVTGQGRECYFLLVVDDYTRYTTVFPLRSKGQVVDVLIPWIRTVRLQLCERFGKDLPVLPLHSNRGGEFSSNLLRDFCRGEGILQSHGGRSYLHDPCGCSPFMWPFAVQYAMHLLNLWHRVSLLETSPTPRWTGKVGDASVFWVWGSRAFVRVPSVDKLSARAIPCIFLGFVPDAPGWQFYHPTSRRVLPSQDVTFDESVPFYHLFPYRSSPLPPPPLFLAQGPPPVDPLPPHGPAPSGVSQVDPPLGAVPGEAGGAEPGGVETGGAEPGGVKTGGAEPEGAESRDAEPQGAASSGDLLVLRRDCLRSSCVSGLFGAHAFGVELPELEVVELEVLEPYRVWSYWFWRLCTRGARAGGAGVGGSGAGGAGVGGTGARGAGAGGAGAVDSGVGGAGGTVLPRPYFVTLLQQSGGLTERCEPLSRPILPVRTARRLPLSRPPPDPSTHAMTLRPSSFPLRVPLPAPPESSIPEVPDPESDRARATSPTVTRLLASVVIDPSFEFTAAFALVAELVDFASACRLDYATALVAESASPSPSSVGDPDAPDIPTPRSYAEAITGPYSSQWHAAMDAEMASWKSTGTYVNEVPPPGANIVDGMWIFRVKRPPGSPPALKARYVARGFTFLQGSLHEEIWLRRPPGFTGSFPAGTQWSLRRPVYGLRQAPREWHDRLRTTVAALGFAPSIADPSLFLRTDTSLPPFYVVVYVDDFVFAIGDTEAMTLMKSELQKRHTCTDLGELRSYLGLQITRDRARRTITLTQSHMVHQVLQRFGFQFSLPQPTPLSTSH
ncbi:unnamed protein product [Closterium sp. NIES-54]